MEDMRLLLKKAVAETLSDENREQCQRIVDAVCAALD